MTPPERTDMAHDLETVRSAFADAGVQLLATDYHNSKTPMPVVCAKGHHELLSLDDLSYTGCRQDLEEAYRKRMFEPYEAPPDPDPPEDQDYLITLHIRRILEPGGAQWALEVVLEELRERLNYWLKRYGGEFVGASSVDCITSERYDLDDVALAEFTKMMRQDGIGWLDWLSRQRRRDQLRCAHDPVYARQREEQLRESGLEPKGQTWDG
jgi:hypothetical protein